MFKMRSFLCVLIASLFLSILAGLSCAGVRSERDPYEIWVGDPYYGKTLQEVVSAIGPSARIIRVPAGNYSISANLIIPDTVTLKVERGALLSVADTVILSINSPIEAGWYQIFDWAESGIISLSGQSHIKTSWFGDTANGINKALVSVSRPHIFELPRKYIRLGTTSLQISVSGTTLIGQGNMYESQGGTELSYSGSGYALIVGNEKFISKITLKDFTLTGDEKGANGIKMGLPGNYWVRYPHLENVVVKWFTGNGMEVHGSEYGIYRNCIFYHNGSNGILFGVNPNNIDPNNMDGGNINRFESNSFTYNSQVGVLIQTGDNLSFIQCDMQANGYEGLKASTNLPKRIDNLLIEQCWFEGNQRNSSRLNGYYSLVAGTNNYVNRVILRNNSMKNISNRWNGSQGNKLIYANCALLTADSNSYGNFGAVYIPPFCDCESPIVSFLGEDPYVWGRFQ